MVERSSNGMEMVPSSFIVCCTTWFWNWTTIRHVFCILQEFDAGANTVAQWLKKWRTFYTLMKIAAHFSNTEKAADFNIFVDLSGFFVLFWRREGDLNPRTGVTRLLVFEASPFSLLGTSPLLFTHLIALCAKNILTHQPSHFKDLS